MSLFFIKLQLNKPKTDTFWWSLLNYIYYICNQDYLGNDKQLFWYWEQIIPVLYKYINKLFLNLKNTMVNNCNSYNYILVINVITAILLQPV